MAVVELGRKCEFYVSDFIMLFIWIIHHLRTGQTGINYPHIYVHKWLMYVWQMATNGGSGKIKICITETLFSGSRWWVGPAGHSSVSVDKTELTSFDWLGSG